jgi:hypothetical protein
MGSQKKKGLKALVMQKHVDKLGTHDDIHRAELLEGFSVIVDTKK